MTLEAKLRITGDTAQAVKALRDVKKEAEGLKAAATTSSGAKPFAEVSAGAAEASTQVKRTVADIKAEAAERKAAAAADKLQAAETRKRLADEKKAAQEADAVIRQARNQARQLGPQVTDIVVGLATGQSPFYVLLQQGGQLRDLFGGVGGALKALGSIFTVTRVLVGGFAAALGLVAYEAIQGRRESDALNKTLALTGNIAGTSQGQFTALANQIASSQKAAIGSVRETLAALVATGDFTQVSLESAGRAATTLQKLTGQTTEETLKQFADMSSGVAAWAAKSNRAYNFLTVEQYRYIQSLEAQGRTQEAMKVTLDALNNTLTQRAVPAVGFFERAWAGVGRALSGVLEQLRAIGREKTPQENLDDITKRLENVRNQLQGRGGKRKETLLGEESELVAQQAAAQEMLRLTTRSADQQAAALAKNQEEIKKESKSYQDSLTQIALAGIQQRLAKELAAIDQEQSKAEIANAKGLTSQLAYDLKLNELEEKRLQAQARALEAQKRAESGRKVTTPEDTAARTAAVKQLDAQLTALNAKIFENAQKAVVAIETDQLEELRKRYADWQQTFQESYQRVSELANENAQNAAEQISDPFVRATEKASVGVAGLRKELFELQNRVKLQISLTVDPSARAELERQLELLQSDADEAVANRTRSEVFTSLQTSFAELNQSLTLSEQKLALAVEQGALTTEEAEKRKFAARAQALPQLEEILQRLQRMANTDAERNAIEALVQDIQKLKGEASELEQTFRTAGVSNLTTALNDVSSGAKSAKDALLDMVSSFAKTMLNVLNQRLAEKLVKQFTDAAGSNGSGFLGALGSIVGSVAGYFGGGSAGYGSGGFSSGGGYGNYLHSGGIAGAGGWLQRVPAAAFAYAPRYHSGGIAGLKPNEVPAVLEAGEEVLKTSDPRHARNYAGAVGDINIGVTVSGAGGSDDDKRGFGDELAQRIRGVTLDVIAEQKRQGGVLSGRR